ncbi:YjiH family protein [Suttonella ornithocola]|uniref:Uncharacterized protein conserved in bacteria n=2 Tax=Suttonella ornithocola TaxID=279832 RepID=A0A380MPY0_9GAMM|nr:nucleoside recognition domain-containing protein [Suttonella ornithocola]SUO93953.1 Uncharacterized protein conserved in bacteria [Suttonella ornithocola]
MIANGLKSLIGSFIGLFIFFIPIPVGEKWKTPLVALIDALGSGLGKVLPIIVLIIIALLCLNWIVSRINPKAKFAYIHKKDGMITGILFFLALIFTAMLTLGIAPEWLANPEVGGLVMKLAGKVLLTVSIAGIAVLFLTEFGFLEFLGTLLEPLMRPLYRTPGISAVDAITSFVAAPAVGIFLTDKLYRQKIYTEREAIAIMTGFSLCSLGFFTVLVSIGGILDYLPQMILSAFIVNFLLAMIMVRIPPISRKPDTYIDGTPRLEKALARNSTALRRAIVGAATRASTLKIENWINGVRDALLFGVKIVSYVVSIAIIALIIATYTPIFDWLGVIIKPYIELMQLPDAGKIAPTVLITLSELALPAILIAGANAAPAAIFFVCVLSTVQIIFFTESANAMLESEVPIKVWELIVIFLIRTLFAIPLVAIATHLVFR